MSFDEILLTSIVIAVLVMFIIGGTCYKDIRTKQMDHIAELITQGTPPLEARCAMQESC